MNGATASGKLESSGAEARFKAREKAKDEDKFLLTLWAYT